MASDDRTPMTPPSDQYDTVDAVPPGPQAPAREKLTGRERRRRILILSLLLALLALLAFTAYFWTQNRRMPVPQLAREDDMIPPPEFLFAITGSGANTLEKPVGVDVADDGRVYVVDFGKRRISVFDPEGRYLFAFNKVEDGDATQLRNPVHLQVKGDEVWVTDRRLRGIYIFGLDGAFKRRFAPANEEDVAWTPLALAFDDAGRLRVTEVGDTDQHQLIYFSSDESRTAAVGRTRQVTNVEEEPGAFFFPNGLAVAKDGRVYVADGDNRRVQVFDDKGVFRRFVDTSGVPRGLAIDEQERLYVVDALAHTIDVFTLDGERMTQFGTRGFGPGQFNFPNDVALDARGRIYISDRENNQVQVWGWPATVVPASVVPTEPWQWALCLTPLLLLPLLLLLRKRTYVLTPQFIEALSEIDRLDVLKKRRTRYVAPVEDRGVYEGRMLGEDSLVKLVRFEKHSDSDVAALKDKLRCTDEQAIYLTLGERARALLSEDVEVRRLGIVAQVRVLDVAEFLEDVGEKVATATEA